MSIFSQWTPSPSCDRSSPTTAVIAQAPLPQSRTLWRLSHAPISQLSRSVCVLVFALMFLRPAFAQENWFDRLDEALYVESTTGWFRSDLSGLLDLEQYYADQPAPGLLLTEDDWFFNPRLSLFLDTKLGQHFYSLVQVRFDRGFDPGGRTDGDARLDEYFLRYTPFEDSRLNFQAGKFAMVVGNWVPRHLSWDNPFVTAPLPYENVLIIADHAAPPNAPGFLRRRGSVDRKVIWLPIIWGPSYAAGASFFGLVNGIEYAFEIKNAPISSRPYAWDPDKVGWEHPTLSARIGYRPNATWNFGVSASRGAYFLPAAESTLPAGRNRGDFDQTTAAADVAYAWRHWQFWGELFLSRFAVPNASDADTLAYYAEAKYKFTPRSFGALRWNQQLFDSIPNGLGGHDRWDRDIWRIDSAVGYRFTRHLQAKLQYSFGQQNGSPDQGDHVVAGQLTIKF